MASLRVSPYGRALIQRFEGLRLKAYPDGKGRFSIGYGHNGASSGQVITKAEADRLFEMDLKRFELAVNELVSSATTQAQFDALVSFAYNVGVGDEDSGLTGSTLLKRHNAGDFSGAADEFRRWIQSEGKVNETLKSRRETERALYLEGQHATPPAPPVVTPPGLPPPPVLEPPPGFPALPPPPLVAGFGGEVLWQWILVPVFFWPPGPSVAGGDEGNDGESSPRSGVAKLADQG